MRYLISNISSNLDGYTPAQRAPITVKGEGRNHRHAVERRLRHLGRVDQPQQPERWLVTCIDEGTNGFNERHLGDTRIFNIGLNVVGAQPIIEAVIL